MSGIDNDGIVGLVVDDQVGVVIATTHPCFGTQIILISTIQSRGRDRESHIHMGIDWTRMVRVVVS